MESKKDDCTALMKRGKELSSKKTKLRVTASSLLAYCVTTFGDYLKHQSGDRGEYTDGI